MFQLSEKLARSRLGGRFVPKPDGHYPTSRNARRLRSVGDAAATTRGSHKILPKAIIEEESVSVIVRLRSLRLNILLRSQLLSQVLYRLPPSDRLKSALVCRRRAETVSAPPLLEDVELVVAGFLMDLTVPVLIKSRRQYPSLRIDRGI